VRSRRDADEPPLRTYLSDAQLRRSRTAASPWCPCSPLVRDMIKSGRRGPAWAALTRPPRRAAVQAAVTGEGPVANVQAHLSGPFNNNFLTVIGAGSERAAVL